jgi:DnaK suppressor protein
MTRASDDTSSIREIHDLLTQRYDEAYEAWTRQDAVVDAMRSCVDGGLGNDTDRANASAQLDEQDARALALRRQLDDLAIAVEHSEQGSYGRCDRCGGTISADRLELYPAASRCLACDEALEHR